MTPGPRAYALAALLAVAALRPGPGTAQATLDPAALRRIESALAVVSCPGGIGEAKINYTTAVVLSSTAQRSYLLASSSQLCASGARRTVHPQGNIAQSYPARVVQLNANQCGGEADPARNTTCFGPNGVEPLALGMEFIAIERGGLPAAPLARQAVAGEAFVLSFTQPLGELISMHVETRLNATTLPAGNRAANPQIIAARGISNGGVVIDPAGALVAVVWSNTEPPGPLLLLGETPPPLPPTMNYRLDFVPQIRSLAHFSAEQIALAETP